MADLLTELFSSKIRAAVLGYLLPRPHLSRSLTDLSRLLDLPISSLQHECYKLVRIGVLRDWRDGNARRYSPEVSSPLLPALAELVRSAIGRDASLQAALDDMPAVESAFLVEGVPPRLVLVGDLPLDELDAALERVAAALSLPSDRVELAFFRPADWRSRLAASDPYLTTLLQQSLLLLVGDIGAQSTPDM